MGWVGLGLENPECLNDKSTCSAKKFPNKNPPYVFSFLFCHVYFWVTLTPCMWLGGLCLFDSHIMPLALGMLPTRGRRTVCTGGGCSLSSSAGLCRWPLTNITTIVVIITITTVIATNTIVCLSPLWSDTILINYLRMVSLVSSYNSIGTHENEKI